jgi:hypothetical protein
MSLLTACQDAAIRLTGARPTSIFSTDNQFERELASLANETARAVAAAHDWRGLMVTWNVNGDGTTTEFDLPPDYDRMPIATEFYSTRSQIPLARIHDLDQWTEFQITPVIGYPGYWIILSGKLQILPVLNAGEVAKGYYITRNIWSGNKSAATADTDTSRLDERLITLGLIWRWRALKRLEYSEDLRNFEVAFAEAAGRDKGARMLRIGRARVPPGVNTAYPGIIVS